MFCTAIAIVSSEYVNILTIVYIFRRYRTWLKDALHHRSQYTTLCWTSAIALLINAVILIIAYFTLNDTW